MKNKRKKYAKGTGPIGYIPSPSEAIAKNDIVLARAQAKADSNIWANTVIPMASSLLQSMATKGKGGGSQGSTIDASSMGDSLKLGDTTMDYTSPDNGASNMGLQGDAGILDYDKFLQGSQQSYAALGEKAAAGEIEAEGGEVIQTPEGETATLEGPKHEAGGIPLSTEGDPNAVNIPEGTQIFSDRVKGSDGKTMAKRKELRDKKRLSLEEMLSKTPTDKILKNTHKRTLEILEAEENRDLQTQEMASMMAELVGLDGVNEFAYGTGKEGVKKKYARGTGISGIDPELKPWQLPYSTQADRPMEPGEIALAQGLAAEKRLLDAVNGTNEIFDNEASQTASVNNSLVKTKEVNDIAAQALAEKKGEFTPTYGDPSKFYGKVNSASFDPIAKAFIKSKGPTSNNLDFSDKENVKDLQRWIYGKEEGPEIDGMVGPDTIAKGIARQNGISPEGELMPEVKSIFESIPGLTPRTNPMPTLQNPLVNSREVSTVSPSVSPSVKEGSTDNTFMSTLKGAGNNILEGISDTFGNMGPGDMMALWGAFDSTMDPLKNVNENRAGDQPNINPYLNYGKEGLKALQDQQGYVEGQKAEALMKTTRTASASKKAMRNSARGVNTMRALDLASDMTKNSADSDIYASVMAQMMQLKGMEAQMENQQDQVIMAGEEKRDLADRQDRDNYYTQRGLALSNKGKGMQAMGKSLNEMKMNAMKLNLLDTLGDYVSIDKDGNITAKKQEKIKSTTKTTEKTSDEEIAFEKDMLARGYKKDSKGNWIKN